MRTPIALTLLALLSLSAGAARADAAADAEAASHAYAISAPARLSLKVGQTAQVAIAVVPNPGSHVSPEAPVTLSAKVGKDDLGKEFGLAKSKLVRADAKSTDAQGIEFALPVVGKEKGQRELSATLVFYICVEKLCAHQKRELSIPVLVE